VSAPSDPFELWPSQAARDASIPRDSSEARASVISLASLGVSTSDESSEVHVSATSPASRATYPSGDVHGVDESYESSDSRTSSESVETYALSDIRTSPASDNFQYLIHSRGNIGPQSVIINFRT
jgi:hypothetical protein